MRPPSEPGDAVRMIVATHRQAELPPRDDLHLPVHVGAALAAEELGLQRDDEGVNISAENAAYCELTGLYWGWMNLDADGLGLSHYRRYFAGTGVGPAGSRILTRAEALSTLARADMMVARPRRYVIETVESHYRHAHVGADLEPLLDSVARTGVTYRGALDRVLESRSLSLYNMFLARRPVVDEYCDWLFTVLADVHPHLDMNGRDAYQVRALGYLGERLLNVWLAAHPSLSVVRRPVVNTEGEPVVRKAWDMVRRKYGARD